MNLERFSNHFHTFSWLVQNVTQCCHVCKLGRLCWDWHLCNFCHVLLYCFGSFILQDMFLSLQVFAPEGQNMTCTVSVLLTCILNCSKLWRRARLWFELFASTVDRFLSRVSYHICPRMLFFGDAQLYFEKAIRFSRQILMFLVAIWSSLCFWSSIYRFIPPLIVLVRLVPQDL